jgi:hypothetical protein
MDIEYPQESGDLFKFEFVRSNRCRELKQRAKS